MVLAGVLAQHQRLVVLLYGNFMIIYVEYEEALTQSGVGAEDSDEPYSFRGYNYYSSSVTRITKKKPNIFEYEEFEIHNENASEIWVCYVTYDEYDTFGGDNGRLNILEVFEREEDAISFAQAIREHADSNTLRSFCPDNKKSYYIPGGGWGSSLNDIHVESFKIDTKTKMTF